MPRAERPLDPDEGMLARFAADLRLLRDKAGRLPYRELARRAHYSSTTLADAASGRKLPSVGVTLAYVRVCGGDPVEWEARWHALASELAASRAGEAGAAGDDQRCPYVGLRAFQPDDAGYFFGRERLTEDLVARVRAGRFLAVFGASGSGKSSLLRAGLLPRLRAGDAAGSGGSPVVLLTPGPHPLEECAARIAALSGAEANALHDRLRADRRALHVAVLQALADQPPDTDLVLVVDQFEEVFTLCGDEQQRRQFIAVLLTATQAANSRIRVVLGIRADFYPRCSDHSDLVDALPDAQLLVGPMTTDELRRAVTLPAARAECTVDSALLARVVAEATGQAGLLPLVSHAMRETWCRRRGNTLTLSGYEAAGGIQHALARTAETVYDGLTAAHQELTRVIFMQLVAPGEGTEDTKRRATRDELPGGDVATVLDELAGARLVALDADTVEITHEALLHAWPRLRQWINADRAGLLVRRQLADAAAAWRREGRDPSALYRGSRLAAARERLADTEGETEASPVVREFLTASARQEDRAVRWRRAAVALLCVLTLLASAAAVTAFRERATALAERDRAVAGQVRLEAEQLAGTDSSLAAQLDLAAYRLQPTPEAYTNLLSTGNVALSTPLAGHTDIVYAVAFSPDGRTLAAAGRDGTVRLWNASDPTRPTAIGAPLTEHADRVYWLAFSPDGRTLASAGRDRTVRLWNVADPTRPTALGAPLTGHTSYVFSVSFSADGRTLATASNDHTVRLWDLTDPAHATPLGQPLLGHTDAVASATFSPAGHLLASVGHDHTIRLWDTTDPAHPTALGQPLTGHTDTVYAAAFAPDGRTLASVSNDHTVRLWNLTDPAHATALGQPVAGHTDTVYAVAFAPDGQVLATAGADQTVRLWNVADPGNPTALGQPLTGHTGYVYWVAFSPDGHTLASAGADHTVRLWNLPATTMVGHRGPVNAGAFRSDGRVLATAGADRTVRLWNVADPSDPTALGQPLTGHTDGVRAVAFSPDGRTVATAGADSTVRLWDVTDPARPATLGQPLTGHTGGVSSVAFSPDGHTLATAGADRTVRLWNVTDPAHSVPLGSPLTGHADYIYAVAFSPDGRTLATAGADDTLRLWNVADPARTGASGPALTTNTGGVRAIAFRPDGRTLATAGADHTVRLWSIADPAHPTAQGQPLTGHTSFVLAVSFSPDGNTLASGSQDQTVRLWNTADPAHASPLGQSITGHVDRVRWVAFTPDGHTLASAGEDHTIRLLATDANRAIDRLCATTRNTLTPSQWRRYVPRLRFDPPCRYSTG